MREALPSTDWEAYYRSPFPAAGLSRKISALLLKRFLKKHPLPTGCRIREIGGGNSCFYPMLKKLTACSSYTVLDSSPEGCRLFLEKAGPEGKAVCGDLLQNNESEEADLTASFGVIEHFPDSLLDKAIRIHFQLTRKNGLVLMSFPVRSLSYRLIRFLAEKTGIWAFPDENPPDPETVNRLCRKYGTPEGEYRNDWILLSQKTVLFRKNAVQEEKHA